MLKDDVYVKFPKPLILNGDTTQQTQNKIFFHPPQ